MKLPEIKPKKIFWVIGSFVIVALIGLRLGVEAVETKFIKGNSAPSTTAPAPDKSATKPADLPVAKTTAPTGQDTTEDQPKTDVKQPAKGESDGGTTNSKESAENETDSDPNLHAGQQAQPTSQEAPQVFLAVQRAGGLEYGITRCEHEPEYKQIACEGLVRNIGDEPKALSFKSGGSVDDNEGHTAYIGYDNIKYSYNGDLLSPDHVAQFKVNFNDDSRGRSTSVEIKLRARWSVDEHTRPGDLLPLEVPLVPIG